MPERGHPWALQSRLSVLYQVLATPHLEHWTVFKWTWGAKRLTHRAPVWCWITRQTEKEAGRVRPRNTPAATLVCTWNHACLHLSRHTCFHLFALETTLVFTCPRTFREYHSCPLFWQSHKDTFWVQIIKRSVWCWVARQKGRAVQSTFTIHTLLQNIIQIPFSEHAMEICSVANNLLTTCYNARQRGGHILFMHPFCYKKMSFIYEFK